jgi:hypothetical protein
MCGLSGQFAVMRAIEADLRTRERRNPGLPGSRCERRSSLIWQAHEPS